MIPTPQTGKMKKLDPATFREKGWQLITDSQAIRSILKAIRVNDDDYRSLYALTGVVFVHRQDKGGQFISYRQLQQWRNAVAYQIQNCSTCQQLHSLWLAIEGDSEALLRLRSMVRKQQSADRKKHNKQYDDQHYPFLFKIWAKRARTLWKEQELSGNPLILHDYYRNSQELA